MKAHKRRIRLLRGIAIAGSLTALALPGAAGAKPLAGDPPNAVRHDNAPTRYISDPYAGGLNQPTVKKAYTLPSSFKTDAQSAAPGSSKQFALPSGFETDAQSSAPSSAPSSSPSSVVHELRTVTDADGHTLAIVLAAAALGIALCGTGYALVRLALIQRRVLGSSS